MSAIPTITMQQVDSSQFAAIGHVPELNLLAIQFHPKKSTGQTDIYHYQNVSAEMFAEFLGAESQGSFFIQRIKKYADTYPYTKVDQALFNHTSPVPIVKSLAESVAAPVLTKELLAVALHGRVYPFSMTTEEKAQAGAAGLVVVYGLGDDSLEVRGAVNGQQYVYERGTALIDAKGLLPVRDQIEDDEALRDFFAREPLAKKVEAIFGSVAPEPSWTYSTALPHATFEIMEDGDVYCRGIVISVADLGGAP